MLFDQTCSLLVNLTWKNRKELDTALPDGRFCRPGGPSQTPRYRSSCGHLCFAVLPDERTNERTDRQTGVNRGVRSAMCAPTDVSRALTIRITDVCHVHKSTTMKVSERASERERERKGGEKYIVRIHRCWNKRIALMYAWDFLDDYYKSFRRSSGMDDHCNFDSV